MGSECERGFDVPFYPYDDISYHHEEKDKNGVRCVVVVPSGFVKTTYVLRQFSDMAEVMAVKDKGSCKLNNFFSEPIRYNSANEPKTLCAISLSYSDKQLCCIKYKNEPLLYADACIITGDNFTDLPINICYALVMSARACYTDGVNGVSVNIDDDMDLMPRLVSDEK